MPEPAETPARKDHDLSDVAFDLWLERVLHAMFDGVAKEPIPPELLALIEQDINRT
jgi:hypothetical protein